MAIDELIASGIRPPMSPLESMGQAMQMRDMVQRRQINDERLSQEKIQTHLAQQAASDDAATRQIMAAHTTQGPDGAPTLDTPGAVAALYQGGQYKAAQSLRLQTIENQAKVLANQKTAAEVHAKNAERIGSAAGAVLAAKPEDQAAAYARGITDLVSEGAIPTAQGNTMLQAGWSPQAAAQLQQYQRAGMDSKDQHEADIKDIKAKLEQAEEDRQRILFPAKFQEADAAAKTKTLALAGQQLGAAKTQAQWDNALAMIPAEQRTQFSPIFSPAAADQARRAGMTANEQATADQAAAQLAQTTKRDEQTKTNENANLNIRRGELKVAQDNSKVMQNRYNFDASGGVSPAAQMAANGQMSPATLRSMLRSNPGMMGQIMQVDPNFDEGNIEQRYKTIQEFSKTGNGSAGGTVIALNTLIHHADLYMQTAEALKNGTFKPGNAVYNYISQQLGQPAPTDAALVSRLFASETGKVATGGVPAEGEVNGLLKAMSTDGSPEAMMSAGRRMLEIAAGKMTPLQERVNEAKAQGVIHIIGPDAKEILEKRGFDPNTMKPKAAAAAGGKPAYQVGQSVMYNGAPHKITAIKADGKLVLEN
jgi:hypothetical protein